jgi:hypothetical protein
MSRRHSADCGVQGSSILIQSWKTLFRSTRATTLVLCLLAIDLLFGLLHFLLIDDAFSILLYENDGNTRGYFSGAALAAQEQAA